MRQKPKSCENCPCHDHGSDFSAVSGTGSLGVLVVAEASGEHEQREGRPLVEWAPAGGVFERALRRMGLDRKQFSLTNTIRCRPRNNWLESAPWEYAALRHCWPNLDATIAERRPRAILTLGNVPTRELTGMDGEAQGVGHLAGYVLPTYQKVPEPCTESDCIMTGKAMPNCFMCGGTGVSGEMNAPAQNAIPVIPTFHPAFIRRGKASYQGLFARNIQRAVNVASGRDRLYLWGIDPSAKETHGSLSYQTHPTLDDAEGFAQRVLASPRLTLSYDLETFESSSLDEDARDGFTDTYIRLVQFSLAGNEGIAFPWEGRFRDIAARILHSPNVKCGHNVWLFDNKVLAAAGAREGLDLAPRGTVRDTLQMFHHWQPDLPAHLQFAAQWVSFPFPWKHLAGSDLEFYGCCDADATGRLHDFLEASLRRDGIWDGDVDGQPTLGYVGQVEEVRPVLAAMEDRGLPIDDDARLRLDGEFDIAQQELLEILDRRFPDEARSIHPKEGYKKTPKDYAGLSLWQFQVPTIDATSGEPVLQQVERWCRLEAFSPNSSQQLVRYMKAKGHKVPKAKEQDADGNDKDTTAKKELVRLAHKSGDDFYLKTIEYRELNKARSTYIEGFKPHADGCVHTTFTFDTGIGQLSSRNPNIQNFIKHGRLAKATRGIVAAKPGHILVEWDYKSCHVLTLGFLAEDANYIRCARIDMHSIVTGHKLKLWHALELLRDNDDAFIRARCKWLKQNPEWKHIRDARMKHAILGIGNGLKARGLYEKHMEDFASQKEAQSFLDVAEELFPKVFAWHKKVQDLAHQQQFLKTQYGHMRRFYEVYRWDAKKGGWGHGDQHEEAISYCLSNIAFGYIREHMKAVDRLGLAERYGMCNNVHDSLLFHFPQELLARHVRDIYPVLVKPSKVLVHPTIAPDGLYIDCEANAGRNWAEMEEVPIKEILNEGLGQRSPLGTASTGAGPQSRDAVDAEGAAATA